MALPDYKKVLQGTRGERLEASEVLGNEGINLEDYSRPQSEYTEIETIVQHIENREGSQHIYSEDLRVNGELKEDSFEKYLKAKDYYSSSFLKKALATHRHVEFEINENPLLKKYLDEKNCFVLGTFIHQCILEPTKFSRVFVEPYTGLNANSTEHHKKVAYGWFEELCKLDIMVEEPKGDLKRGDYKDYVEKCKNVSGIQSISDEDNVKIKAFKQVYDQFAGGFMYDLIKHSKREISGYTIDEETGLPVRVRADALQFKENIGADTIISVKSTSAENFGHFMYHCGKYHYDLTEAMYQDVYSDITGRSFRNTLMIMAQTVPPFGMALIQWTPEDIAGGRFKYRHALQNILEYNETGYKSTYDSYAEPRHRGIIKSALPEWTKRDLEARSFID